MRDLSEGAEEFYDITARIYKAAHDSALAVAYFESDLVNLHLAESEEGQEVPDEFQRTLFQETHRKLLELRTIKDFAEAFNLGAFLPEIMRARIDYLFGRSKGSSSVVVGRGGAFYGTDEEYLMHNVKQKAKGGR